MAKGAVEGLTRTLAASGHRPFASIALRLLTDTPLAAPMLSSDTKREAAADRHPLKAVGSADGVASLATWLLAGGSDFVTGQVYTADGGMEASANEHLQNPQRPRLGIDAAPPAWPTRQRAERIQKRQPRRHYNDAGVHNLSIVSSMVHLGPIRPCSAWSCALRWTGSAAATPIGTSGNRLLHHQPRPGNAHCASSPSERALSGGNQRV